MCFTDEFSRVVVWNRKESLLGDFNVHFNADSCVLLN